VSVFRPAARVTSPDGRAWEIYVYRLRLPHRGDTFDPGLAEGGAVGPVGGSVVDMQLALGLVDAVLWLLGLVPRLLLRVLWDVPRARLHALRTDEWTVEAVTWYPVHVSYTWTIGRVRRDAAVREVARQLRRGQIPPRFAREAE
jgi:hypothetical protein